MTKLSDAVPATNSIMSGWSGIEAHMLAYDTDMIRGYTDDIDTLLVFAGLFSSILSAFAVQTYQLLQQDTLQTTNQLIALGLSSYLGNTHTISSDILTSMSTTSSTSSIAARWINSLFFLSIVLSLAAALLGIRAKQWLRKYMEWNSSLGSPRDNVLVRQIRIEAWEKWNVDVTIACIPTLLELAMVSFLVGITLLLWTLDGAVASAITTFVAVFFLVISGFTVLPVFYKRCPYKSSSAWALITAFHAIALGLRRTIRFLRTYQPLAQSWWNAIFPAAASVLPGPGVSYAHTWLALLWTPIRRVAALFARGVTPLRTRLYEAPRSTKASSWRERELESAMIIQLPTTQPAHLSYEVRDAARLELAREAVPLSEDGTFAINPQDRHVNGQDADVLLMDISQSALLIRALSWVQIESQDSRIERYIHECIGSLHPAHSVDLSMDTGKDWFSSCAVTNLCLVSAIFNGTLHKPHSALVSKGDEDEKGAPSVTGLRKSLGVSAQSTLTDPVFNLDARTIMWRSEMKESSVLLLLLCADFGHILSQYNSPNVHDHSAITRRALETVSLLDKALDYQHPVDLADSFFINLSTVINRALSGGLESLPFDAICSAVLRLAFKSAHVSEDGNGNMVISRGKTARADYESILYGCFTGDFNTYSGHVLDMYILTVTQCFKMAPIETSSHMGSILLNMNDAVTASVRHPRVRPSGVDDRSWIFALCNQRHSLSENHGSAYRRLLHRFERYRLSEMLQGDQIRIRRYLDMGLEVAHTGIESCEEPDCVWLAYNHSKAFSLPSP